MMANVRKILFICTVIMLGIGVGMVFIHEKTGINKQNIKTIRNVQELLARYNELKRQETIEKIDLSSDEDLAAAIMNLLGIEEHLFFTGAKVNKTEYYDLINEIRETRESMLKKLIPQYEGEVWCIAKHLLAASYRLMEAGIKQMHSGNREAAYEMYDQAYKLYLLFWKINKSDPSVINNAQSGIALSITSQDKSIRLKDLFQSNSAARSYIFVE